MFLEKMALTNFRSCRKTTVNFQPDLTVIVGENNSGKSNLIDAIRLATAPLNGRRSRYFERSDFSHGTEQESIEFAIEFDGLTEIQRGQYITALDLERMIASYRVAFKIDEERPSRSRPVWTAGPGNGPDSESEKRDQISHVYLEPLRDARRELDSASTGRLLNVIELLTQPETQQDFVAKAKASFEELEEHDLVSTTRDRIQEHLDGLTAPVALQGVGVKFADHELWRLARALRLKMASVGVNPVDLADSGLGYANLLFIATVLLQLRNARDSELTLLLVEEPEAHLHPQLQTVLLSYLREQAQASVRDDADGPAGRVQVVVTTHSPNIASSVPIENIVVLRTQPIEAVSKDAEPEAGETTAEQPSAEAPKVETTHAIPLAKIEIDATERNKISRYLDVTKAALFFGRRIILVEGISESVLLPVLGQRCLDRLDNENAKGRLVDGLTIINIDGTDFAPYVRLLLTHHDGVGVVDRLVIVTDGDPTDEDDTEEIGAHAGSRKEQLEQVAAEIGAEDNLKVFASDFTLEADLFGFPANDDVMKAAFLTQKPRSQGAYEQLVGSADRARAFYDKLRSTRAYIRKGQFALDISAALDDGDSFECPEYLCAAIMSALEIEASCDVQPEHRDDEPEVTSIASAE